MDGKKLTWDFKKELEAHIKEKGENNGLKSRGGFVSEEFLERLFNSENLVKRLDHDFRNHKYLDLVSFIRKRAKRVYGILVLIDEPMRIRSLKKRQPSVDDALLFHATGKESRVYCRRETLRKDKDLEDIADQFFEMQWIFPPTLSSEKTLEFDPKLFRFPFNTEPIHKGSGGSGQVHEIKVDETYIVYPKDFNIDARRSLVYKKIRQEVPRGGRQEGWGRLMQEVETLRARQHDHITPLLASFIAGLEKPSRPKDDTQCLYLISPLAEMDMDSWMRKEPDYVRQFSAYEHKLHQHIGDAMGGLISGLTYIHREIDHKVGYHGDLKPKNILLFRNPNFIWKICDFGTSNLKSIDETGTKNFATTRYWAPMEFFEEEDKTNGQNHGRAHDVWSLGCIFLLLATVMAHGWKGLKEFENRRMGNSNDDSEAAFYKNTGVVQEWIQELKLKATRDQYRQVLELIEEMLKPRRERIFSWEVEVDLYCILDPERPANDTLKHLRDVIQAARKIDSEMEHSPLSRASKRKRRDSFLKVLKLNGWYDEKMSEEEDYYSTTDVAPTSPEDEKPTRLLEDDKPMFGREDLLAQISSAFVDTRAVALHGLGGIGKTHVAERYFHQNLSRELKSSIKHSFWVQANNISVFKESYHEIADRIESLETCPGEDIVNAVKHYLDEGDSGEDWFMVIDGLDDAQEIQSIKPLLPRYDSGWVLITTRNRYLVKDLVDFKKSADIKVDRIDEEASLELLSHYMDQTLMEEMPDHAKELLNLLWCPDITICAAQHMNVQARTCKEMCEFIKDDGPAHIERLYPNLADRLLGPIQAFPLESSEEWPREVQLLFLLSMFDNQTGVDFDLIRAEYDIDDVRIVRNMLDTLRNCSLIKSEDKEVEDVPRKIYFVNNVVRLAVLAWVEAHEGKRGFVIRYNKALSMMFRAYDKNKRAIKTDEKAMSKTSFKLLLMPHFRGFVRFTQTTKVLFDFTLYYRAVQAITLLSDILIGDGHHNDAISVLGFARKQFWLKELKARDEGTMQRQRSVYFRLNHQLLKAYLSRPRDENSHDFLKLAEDLVQSLLPEARSADDLVYWAGKTLREWDLMLCLVRVFWESRQFPNAQKQLKAVQNSIDLINGNICPPEDEGLNDLPIGSDVKTIQGEIRKLAIRVKREEGLLNLSVGQMYKEKRDLKKAKKPWMLAQKALYEAQTAAWEWFPKKVAQLHDLEFYRADADAKIGTGENLDRAIRFFKKELKIIRQENGDQCTQYWDMECKLIAAQLRQGNDNLSKDDLERLLENYEDAFGSGHERTIECAWMLRDVLERCGNTEGAYELSDRFPELPRLKQRFGRWAFWYSHKWSAISREYLSVIAVSIAALATLAVLFYSFGVASIIRTQKNHK